MYFFYYPFKIPNELLNHPNQVNLVVGENGSGKSTLLRELARHFAFHTGCKVIGVANTIHDKFDISHPNFEVLKASHGKSIVRRTIKSALQSMVREGEGRYYQIAETLRYVNFDAVIGIKIAALKPNFDQALRYGDLTDDQRNVIAILLERYRHTAQRARDGIIKVDLYRNDFSDLKDSGILELLEFESLLKKLKMLKDINIYLQKDGQLIPANQSSSGELTLISSFVFIMATMAVGARVLIDEPENSLHPKWQIEYTGRLYDLVYRYEPSVFIATHSPLVINSTEIDLGERVTIYKGNGRSFEQITPGGYNVEEVYQELFDVTTPENRFLSQFVVKKMNQLADNQISIKAFEQLISDLNENAYDPRQKQVLDGVIVMAREIEERKRNQ
ncbi:AAA family ATPase [Mucilaginibacter sp. AW1-3]